MLLSQALDTAHKFSPQEFAALADLLSPELIDECLADTGIVTLRKPRLSMEMMVWAVRSFVAVVQARQRLGEYVIRLIFEKTRQLWLEKTPLSHRNGLTLMAVDGTLWRAPDTPENDVAFNRTARSN